MHFCKNFLNVLLIAGLQFIGGHVMSQSAPPAGKLWGYAFGDAYVKAAGDTATWASRAEYSGVPKEVYAFALRRMYLEYDYTISPKFSTTALLEAQDGFQDTKGDRTVTIKSLHLRWKNIFGHTDFLIGQMPTLSYAVLSEKVWKYRSIEKMMIDQRGVRSSSDMGVALSGVFDSLRHFGYSLMIGNGTGTKPEDLTPAGKHKIYSAEVFGNFLDSTLLVELYGDIQTGINDKSQALLKGLVAYQTKRITLGMELMQQTLNKNKSDLTDTRLFGVSVFARGVVIKDKLNFYARYDSFNPDQLYRDQDILTTYNAANMSKHYDEQFFVGGFDWMPHKNVHFMPNVWVNSYSAKGESILLVDRKADVVPRLTFMFEFRDLK